MHAVTHQRRELRAWPSSYREAPTSLTCAQHEQLGDVVLLRDDGLDDGERKRLHESIRRGVDDGRAGRVTDLDEFLDELDAQP